MTLPNAVEAIAQDKDDLRYGEKQPLRKGGRPIEKLKYGHDCRMKFKINH